MLVSKWGNSLAVRLPAELVKELALKEGDEIELSLLESGAGRKLFSVSRTETLEDRLSRAMGSFGPLPKDYKFDREEANARGKDVS